MRIIKILSFFYLCTTALSQATSLHKVPTLYDRSDLSLMYKSSDLSIGIDIPSKTIFKNALKVDNRSYLRIDTDIRDDGIYTFVIDSDKAIIDGAYLFQKEHELYAGKFDSYGNTVTFTRPVRPGTVSIEIVLQLENAIESSVGLRVIPAKSSKIQSQRHVPINGSSRQNPTILVTGFWPPTNEMIRHFSQDPSLNPGGWDGENWEGSGYDIISYFPEFSDPDCNNCGQGYGDFEVDYQDTSDDFWPIFNSHDPVAVITFSRGYIDRSWELEFNYYNRTNWYPDYSAPTLPTPNPPDSLEESYLLRNSSLPMEQIVNDISHTSLDIDPYIDWDGDPGRFVSEFMGYHGVWYHDLNLYNDQAPCLAAGHVHVGGQLEIATARAAAEETIRTVIEHVDNLYYVVGDLNEDGIIDILDLVTMVSYILGSLELDTGQVLAADINEDGIINIQDIIGIINIIINS